MTDPRAALAEAMREHQFLAFPEEAAKVAESLAERGVGLVTDDQREAISDLVDGIGVVLAGDEDVEWLKPRRDAVKAVLAALSGEVDER